MCGGKERGSCISNEKDKHFCVSFTLGTFMSLLLIFNETDLNFFFFLLCEGFIKNVSETFYHAFVIYTFQTPFMYFNILSLSQTNIYHSEMCKCTFC